MANLGNIRTWVDALRSGEFEQGHSRLAAKGKYCCLGVACALALRDGVALSPEPLGDNCSCATCQEKDEGIQWFDGESTHLPIKVQDWLDLKSPDPTVDYFNAEGEEARASLAELNDGGRTFSEIADIIEANFLSTEPGEKVAA